MNVATLSELKAMNDEDVIRYYQAGTENERNRAAEVLINRYTPMINKHMKKLMTELNGIYYANNWRDDFISEAYFAIMKAADKVDFNKIQDKNWKFTKFANYHLCTARKIVREKVIKLCSCELSMNAADNSSDDIDSYDINNVVEGRTWDDEYMDKSTEEIAMYKDVEERLGKIIESCYKDWTDIQKNVFDYLQQGYTKKEIATLLNTKVANVYHTTSYLKKQLLKKLAS